MSPGINDGPRNTGTLPKSNRRSDRNRERSAVNQQVSGRSTVYRGDSSQHPNNLLQLDWQPVSEHKPHRTAKNNNTRSVSSAPSVTYDDFCDYALDGASIQYNYIGEEITPWQRMFPPAESRTQSPPHLQGPKPTNIDRMPDRGQVESRLNQIRDYIRVTSTMMDSLNQSNDPRARAQHEKLSRMVEDLSDSESKLAKLLEDYHNHRTPDESGDHLVQRSKQMKRFTELADILTLQGLVLHTNSAQKNGENGRENGHENNDGTREAILRRKMEESQRKLAQLQEHQANLEEMQVCARERLNEARKAQALLLQENQTPISTAPWDGNRHSAHPSAAKAEELESETAVLRGKLAQLQSKKKRMDHLIAELQAVDAASDRGSCSSGSWPPVVKDKIAELDAMKAQLAHLKALMEEATGARDSVDSVSEAEQEGDAINAGGDDVDPVDEDRGASARCNSFDRHSNADETNCRKPKNSGERPTVEQVQAVSQELKEQSALLKQARAELLRLKQASNLTSSAPSAPAPSRSTSTPPPSFTGYSMSEKNQSNNNNNSSSNSGDIQLAQVKRRQLEELMRKEQGHSSSVNRDMGGTDWPSHRGSDSLSHTSTPANHWPLQTPTAAAGSNDQSVDGISSAENLLDIGPQGAAVENGLGGNWWGLPAPPISQPQQGVTGTAEYYRQLLLGSQAQQLQMMGTTVQQCCQLLWSQQREMQSMRAAIAQLQLQLRQSQLQPRLNNVESPEEHSNLSHTVHHLGNSLDAALPPSSSLPNLVSLPNPSPAPSRSPAAATAGANSQQHHQQQLNNQVPPGNRANNYWDNFRSYSRQNLLSGNSKTTTERSVPLAATNASTPTNTASSSVNSSLARDKRNREHGSENIPLLETQYSLNLHSQSTPPQQQEREVVAVARSNILNNESSQQQQVDNFWEEAHSSFHLVPGNNDDHYSLRYISDEISDVFASLVAANRRRSDYLIVILREIKAISEDHRLRPCLLRSLRALRDTQSSSNPLNEATDQTASESCQSSDDDSDVGAQACAMINSNAGHQSSSSELLVPLHPQSSTSMAAQVPLIDHFNNSVNLPTESAGDTPTVTLTPGCNEDLAEADQSRPETSGNQLVTGDESNNEGEDDEGEAIANPLVINMVELETRSEDEEGEGERAEDAVLDRIPTRLYHHIY